MKNLLKRLTGATRLMKSETAPETDDAADQTEEKDETQTAFDAAVAEVQKSVSDEPDSKADDKDEDDDTEDLAKAKKKKNKKDKDKKDEDDDEEDDTSTTMPPGMKSGAFTKAVTEDPDVRDAVEVEPFLRSLAQHFGECLEKFSERLTRIEKSYSASEKLQKSHAGLSIEIATLTKSVADIVNAVSEQPEDRKSDLTVQDRFAKSDGTADYNPREIRTKLANLAKAKVLQPVQVGIVEGRLNHGQALPDWFQQYLDVKE